MGQEVLAPRNDAVGAGRALTNALGAEGAAVIDVCGGATALVAHRAGGGADEVLAEATALLATAGDPAVASAKGGRPILVAACRTRFGADAGVALWRSPGSRGWDNEDRLLIHARRWPDPRGTGA
jgi:hypothetical protein